MLVAPGHLPTVASANSVGLTGRYLGMAVRSDFLRDAPGYAEVVLRECSSISPETAMKWAAIEPEAGHLDFRDADSLEDFALEHSLDMRGHTLLWHGSIPQWAAARLRDHGDWGIVQRYFSSVIPRYGRSVQRWDVVNEPIEVGQRDDGMRVNPFLAAFGPDYVERALEMARMFAPQALLYVNEHGMEYEAEFDTSRRYHFLRLLERLKARGAPIDGVGLEGHLDLKRSDLSEKGLSNFLANIADLGLRIAITELDVREYDFNLSVAERDARIADETRRYLDIVLAQPAVEGITIWGVDDSRSWLQNVTPGMDRANPTSLNRGLPFDGQMKAKPMHGAILSALGHPPSQG